MASASNSQRLSRLSEVSAGVRKVDTPHPEFSLRTDGEQAERNREFTRRVAAARPRKLGYDNALVRPAALSERPSRERIQPMPMTSPRQSAAAAMDHAVRAAAVRRDPSRAFRSGVRPRAASHARKSSDRRVAGRPRSSTRWPRSTPAARRSRASRRSSTTSRHRKPRPRCRPSSARCRRGLPRTIARSISMPDSSPASTRCSAARRAWPHARAARLLAARASRFRARRRRLSRVRPRRGYAAIVERLATLSTRFGQNVLADEASLPPRAEGRARSRRPAGGPARGGALGRAERGESDGAS